MNFLSDTVILSRMQFALTAIFHMLWPVLTTGMAIYLVVVEGLCMFLATLETSLFVIGGISAWYIYVVFRGKVVNNEEEE